MERFYIKILFLASSRKQRETQGALGLRSGSAQTLQFSTGKSPSKPSVPPSGPTAPSPAPRPAHIQHLPLASCAWSPAAASPQPHAWSHSGPHFPWRPSLNSPDLTSHVRLPCSCPSAFLRLPALHWAGWRRRKSPPRGQQDTLLGGRSSGPRDHVGPAILPRPLLESRLGISDAQ